MVLSTLVNVTPPVSARMMAFRLWALFEKLSVPPPDNWTLVFSRSLTRSPTELNWRRPELEMLPLMKKSMLSATMSVSPASMVRVPMLTTMSRVTTDAMALPLSMHTLTVVLLGTAPVLHIAALLQLPVPPSQFVVLPVHTDMPSGWAPPSPPLPPTTRNPVSLATKPPPGVVEVASSVWAEVVDDPPEAGLASWTRLAAGKSTEVVAPASITAPVGSTAMPRPLSELVPPR